MTARPAPAQGRVFCWVIGRRTSTTPSPGRSAILPRQVLEVSLRPRAVRRGAGKADITVGANKAEVPGIGPPGRRLHQLRELPRQRRDRIGRADGRETRPAWIGGKALRPALAGLTLARVMRAGN